MSSRPRRDGSIIDTVYAAASEPDRWPEVLTHVADHVGAIGGMLVFNAPPGQGSLQINGRLDDDLGVLFRQRYVWNAWTAAMMRHPRGQPVAMNSLVDVRALRRTAFHADILAPQGIDDMVNWSEKSLTRDGCIGGFGFCLSSRRAERADEVVRQLKPLLPHLSRALDISLQLGQHADGTRQLGRMLQFMPNPALLLNGRGHVVHANAAAEAVLRDGDGLTTVLDTGTTLAAAIPREARMLARAVASALSIAAGGEETAIPPVQLTRPSGRSPLLVVLAPLPPPAFVLWEVMDGARVLVLVFDPEAPRGDASRILERFYGLTRAEARVAALVGGGLSGPQAAATLGVSPQTVKTHLAHCFAKLNVHSQVELANLVGALAAAAPALP